MIRYTIQSIFRKWCCTELNSKNRSRNARGYSKTDEVFFLTQPSRGHGDDDEDDDGCVGGEASGPEMRPHFVRLQHWAAAAAATEPAIFGSRLPPRRR